MNPDDLKTYRKRHKITQAELAKKLEVKPRTVAAWETGQNPTPAWVEKFLQDKPAAITPAISYETYLQAIEIAKTQGLDLETWIGRLIEQAVASESSVKIKHRTPST